MRRTGWTAFLLLIAAGTALAQTDSLWYLIRGGPNADESWAVTSDPAGDLYWATHQTVVHPWPSIQLYKLRPDSSPVWNIRWGDSLGVMCYVVFVREPYVYFGGAIWGNTADMIVVCCSTANGHEAWRWSWGQGYGYEEVDGLVVDSTGVYVAGWTMASNNMLDLAVARLTLDGELDWLRTWGTPNWDEENGQIRVDDRNVYVSGRYNGLNALFGGDALLAAFDKTTGDTLWHRTWGGAGFDDAFGMTGDTSGLYLVGITGSFGNGTQIFLLKYDYSGNLVWDTLWGGPGEDLSRAIDIGPDGYLYVAGKSDSPPAESTDVLLLKFTRSGHLVWSRLWGGPRDDESHGIATYGDYIYIAGETSSYGAGANDALLVKARNDGSFPGGIEEPMVRPEPPVGTRLRRLADGRYAVDFNAGSAQHADLALFDLTGRRVRQLFDGTVTAGEHEIVLRLPGDRHLLFLRLAAGSASRTWKLLTLR